MKKILLISIFIIKKLLTVGIVFLFFQNAGAQTLINDSFTDTNGTLIKDHIPNNRTDTSFTWGNTYRNAQIQGNVFDPLEAVCTTINAGSYYFPVSISVKCTTATTSGGDAALAWRVQSPSSPKYLHKLRIVNSSGYATLEMKRTTNDSDTLLSTSSPGLTIPSTSTYITLNIFDTDTYLTGWAYIPGTAFSITITATDTTRNNQYKCGILCLNNQTFFDDFYVNDNSLSPTPTPIVYKKSNGFGIEKKKYFWRFLP